MSDERKEFIWAQAYRPKTVDDCILPDRLKTPFRTYVKNKNVPNLILTGSPGVGKTTVAEAMCHEIGCDWIKINGSDERGIDTFRSKISNYASVMAMQGGRKIILIDEADGLTPEAQAAMRSAIEQYSHNVSFVLTCNFKSKILDALQSRNPPIEFRLSGQEKVEMAKLFYVRVCEILDTEKVKYDKAVIPKIIMKFFPDYRRILGELQHYAAQTNNNIDVGILANSIDDSIKDVIGFMKDKDYKNVRQWAARNAGDAAHVFRSLYSALETITGSTYPHAVLFIADYQYKAAFCADQEINLVACLTEIMLNCTFQ